MSLQNREYLHSTSIWQNLRTLAGKTGEKKLGEFRRLVKDSLGEEVGTSVIDAACVCLVTLCLAQDKFSHKFLSEFKAVSGPVTTALAERALRLTKEALEGREEEAAEAASGGSGKTGKPFGEGIEFKASMPKLPRSDDPQFAYLTDLRDNGFSLRNELTFDLEAAKIMRERGQETLAASNGPRRDVVWLEEEIKVR